MSEEKHYLPPRLEKIKLIDPAHLEEWLGRGDHGLFDFILTDLILYNGYGTIANVTENIRRAFAWRPTIGVSYKDRAKVKDEKEGEPAGFNVREWMEGVQASGAKGITHTGGKDKICVDF